MNTFLIYIVNDVKNIDKLNLNVYYWYLYARCYTEYIIVLTIIRYRILSLHGHHIRLVYNRHYIVIYII